MIQAHQYFIGLQNEKNIIVENIELLRESIRYHSKKYYIDDEPEISDTEFDQLFHLLKKWEEIENDKIIITHGTDTMVDTAEQLKEIKNKTIVLVGSAKPEKFKGSDAAFNIGLAVGGVSSLENGVYIAMNGQLYKGDECKKQRNTGQFIPKIIKK